MIRKQRGYLSDNVGSEVRWRTRLRFYGADKKLITERGSCLVVCLLEENRLTQKGMPRISPRKHPSYLFRGARHSRLVWRVCTCNIWAGTPRFNVNHTLCVLPIVMDGQVSQIKI